MKRLKNPKKVSAVMLTAKAVHEIILALRSARRSTEKERQYLRTIIGRLERQTGELK